MDISNTSQGTIHHFYAHYNTEHQHSRAIELLGNGVNDCCATYVQWYKELRLTVFLYSLGLDDHVNIELVMRKINIDECGLHRHQHEVMWCKRI